MKVLIINKKDQSGGAARAAYRLHSALQNKGVDSKMLVLEKVSKEKSIYAVKATFLETIFQYLDKLVVRLYKKNKEDIFSPSFFGVSVLKSIQEFNPDIVHLHWTPRGFLSLRTIKKIKQPIVWSLHDMWPFTGGCHYDNDCGQFSIGCGKCPILHSNKRLDLSRIVLKRKQIAFGGKKQIVVVGLSGWMASQAMKSQLFKNKEVVNLPNPINTKVFYPTNKTNARSKFNIPANKKVVLFGAMDSTSDLRKGYRYLKEALSHMSNEIDLVVFGNKDNISLNDYKQRVHLLGTVNNDTDIVDLYSCADVVVVPSLQENLSNVIVESIACGTPVVGFNIGGNSDIIEHKKTGYLAEPLSSSDLKVGIEWVLDNLESKKLGENCLSKINTEFEESVVCDKYLNLYNSIVKK